jgi:hypothetical protein
MDKALGKKGREKMIVGQLDCLVISGGFDLLYQYTILRFYHINLSLNNLQTDKFCVLLASIIEFINQY